ncbi:MAG: 16S rRNA (guanine(527)-N(7))-methyltransferase RsmG [Bacillota bacterium]
MESRELLVSGVNKLGLEITDQQVEQLLQYLDILQKWNQKVNLTAIDETREIIIKHFLDSISCATVVDLTDDQQVIDVGTGAGFPGLPLKILFPQLDLTLLDARQKRITFLRKLVRQLDLSGVELMHGRAEDYGQHPDYREQFDLVFSRAVAGLNILVEYTVPFLKPSGQFISQKGAKVKEEVIEAQRAVEVLGAEFYDVAPIDLPFTEAERYLVIIDKVSETPQDYPRQAGMVEESPITI